MSKLEVEDGPGGAAPPANGAVIAPAAGLELDGFADKGVFAEEDAAIAALTRRAAALDALLHHAGDEVDKVAAGASSSMEEGKAEGVDANGVDEDCAETDGVDTDGPDAEG